MIRSLEEAWDWYRAVRTLAYDMNNLAGRWDTTECSAFVHGSNRLRDRKSVELVSMSRTVLEELDDLAVLVLFSVFEASVRSLAVSQVEIETAGITHVAAKRALAELKDSMSNGSFARVTDAYQRLDIELTTQVDQVRKFRNWVAHGRREAPENSVTPEEAFERLRRHLDLVRRTGGSPDRTT